MNTKTLQLCCDIHYGCSELPAKKITQPSQLALEIIHVFTHYSYSIFNSNIAAQHCSRCYIFVDRVVEHYQHICELKPRPLSHVGLATTTPNKSVSWTSWIRVSAFRCKPLRLQSKPMKLKCKPVRLTWKHIRPKCKLSYLRCNPEIWSVSHSG